MQRNVHEKGQGRVSEFSGREKGEGVIDQEGSEQQVLVGIVEGTPLSSGDMGPALRAGIARLIFVNVSAGQGERLSLGKEVSIAGSGFFKPSLYLSRNSESLVSLWRLSWSRFTSFFAK